MKDKNLQIEAQTRSLLGKGGMNDQVEKSKDELEQLKQKMRKTKKMYAHDIQKLDIAQLKLKNKKKELTDKNIEHEKKTNELYSKIETRQ